MITKKESNYIKLVGIITMLIDHIGAFLFPFSSIFRIIGRIAFPLFAYQLGIGYKNTKNKKDYIKNLFLFGLISQVPYYLLRKEHGLNILFTLLFGFILIYAIENKNIFLSLFSVFGSFFADYQIYGILIIIIFYFSNKKISTFLLFLISTTIFSLYFTSILQLFALFALLFIFLPKLEISLPKYFFYIFYPLHLLIIYIIKFLYF